MIIRYPQRHQQQRQRPPPQQQHIQLENATTTPSPYAYAFVIGGCEPETPHYRHYLYNIWVATHILRQQGSTQDVVALFQLTWSSNYTTLPEEPDLRVLRALNIRVYYIPKQLNESFYRTQMDKFRILGLSQYRRVLYLDGDVMPDGNLDYLLEMSDQGLIQENLIIQGKYEPAHGGFFMLKPGHLPSVQAMIERRERYARTHPEPHFDVVHGWGHAIEPPDHWYAYREAKGTNWTFLAAFADQGLLYHYVKYYRGNVTIYMRRGHVQNWSKWPNGTVFLESTSDHNPFANYSQTLKCWGLDCFCGPPINDFYHFTARSKPWLEGPPADMLNGTYDPLSSPRHYWYHQLMLLNDRFHLSLDFVNWTTSQCPLLGLYSTWYQVGGAHTNLSTPLIPG